MINLDKIKSLFITLVDQGKKQINRIISPSDFQIGTLSDPKELMLTGRLSFATRQIVFSNNVPILLTNNDSIVEIITSENITTPTITLPTFPRAGQILIIKNTNSVNLTINSTALIDAMNTISLNPLESITLNWVSTKWIITSATFSLNESLVNVSSTYAITSNNNILLAITNLTTPIVITLPVTPDNGQKITIKDVEGMFSTHNVTISGNGKLIDGANSLLINASFCSFTLLYTGSRWSIV